MHTTDLQMKQLRLVNIKTQQSAGDDAQYFYPDNPKQRMERITYHGENIGALEQALQALDPDSYKEYFRTKPRYDSKSVTVQRIKCRRWTCWVTE